jgi:hypothetical protein
VSFSGVSSVVCATFGASGSGVTGVFGDRVSVALKILHIAEGATAGSKSCG